MFLCFLAWKLDFCFKIFSKTLFWNKSIFWFQKRAFLFYFHRWILYQFNIQETNKDTLSLLLGNNIFILRWWTCQLLSNYCTTIFYVFNIPTYNNLFHIYMQIHQIIYLFNTCTALFKCWLLIWIFNCSGVLMGFFSIVSCIKTNVYSVINCHGF